jgi:hypothetical protein
LIDCLQRAPNYPGEVGLRPAARFQFPPKKITRGKDFGSARGPGHNVSFLLIAFSSALGPRTSPTLPYVIREGLKDIAIGASRLSCDWPSLVVNFFFADRSRQSRRRPVCAGSLKCRP